MKIKKATNKDIPALIKLMISANKVSEEKAKDRCLRYISKDKNKLILVLHDDNKIIGYVGLKKDDLDKRVKKIDLAKYCHITWIGVNKESRHLGIGSRLLNASEKIAKVWKKEGIWLGCRKRLIPFYKANDYKIIEKFKENNRLRYIMIKSLRNYFL